MHKVNLAIFVVYIISITCLFIFAGIGITPDRYIFVLLFAALFLHKTKQFLIDWIPFVFILLSYDFLRGLSPFLNSRVNYLPQINFDQMLFGTSSSGFFQKYLFQTGSLHWYDYLAAIFYFLHFALPLAFGFILWLQNRSKFRIFSMSLIVLSYGAFLTYVLFPAAPPWLSSEKGLIEPITKILNLVLSSFPQAFQLPTVYEKFNPNTVAAIPSLHAAYPFLIFLVGFDIYKLKALFFLPYVLFGFFALMYLGEHFLLDILIGMLYASLSFLSVKLLFRRYTKPESA